MKANGNEADDVSVSYYCHLPSSYSNDIFSHRNVSVNNKMRRHCRRRNGLLRIQANKVWRTRVQGCVCCNKLFVFSSTTGKMYRNMPRRKLLLFLCILYSLVCGVLIFAGGTLSPRV